MHESYIGECTNAVVATPPWYYCWGLLYVGELDLTLYTTMVNVYCLIWQYHEEHGYGKIMDKRQLSLLIKTFHYTHSLAIGFIQWTLLFDLGQLHVNLLTNHCHGIPSWTSTSTHTNSWWGHRMNMDNNTLYRHILLTVESSHWELSACMTIPSNHTSHKPIHTRR